MAKISLVFVILAVCCISLSLGARQKREEEETTTAKSVTLEDVSNWFSEVSQKAKDFVNEQLTDERKQEFSKFFDDAKDKLTKGVGDLSEAFKKATKSGDAEAEGSS